MQAGLSKLFGAAVGACRCFVFAVGLSSLRGQQSRLRKLVSHELFHYVFVCGLPMG